MGVMGFFMNYGYPIMTQHFAEQMSMNTDMFLLFLDRVNANGNLPALNGDGENNNPQGGGGGGLGGWGASTCPH